MHDFFLKAVYFYLIGFFLAILEIQIEGQAGWAKNLPTWRPSAAKLWVRFLKTVSGQQEVTGYHLFLNIFLLLFLHWPFVWFGTWNIYAELEMLALFVLFTVVWDFLWFVLNPKFSLRSFNRINVTWHKRWWGRVPTHYLVGVAVTAVLFLPEIINVNSSQGSLKILILLAVNMCLTILTVILYPKAY